MQEHNQPYMPPAPPEPKKKIWPKIVVGVIVLWVIGTVLQQVDDQDTYTSPTVDSTYTPSEGFTLEVARLAWETEITATERANICDYYNTPPVGTTPEMVEAFAGAAEMPYDAADRLLDQLLAEKC